jgi:hypothetical protein
MLEKESESLIFVFRPPLSPHQKQEEESNRMLMPNPLLLLQQTNREHGERTVTQTNTQLLSFFCLNDLLQCFAASTHLTLLTADPGLHANDTCNMKGLACGHYFT